MRRTGTKGLGIFPWAVPALLTLIMLLAALPSPVYAFSVTAQVDRTRISLADTVRLQVIVGGGDAEVDTDPITDFQVISSGTQSSRSYSNGSWKHEVSYFYQLIPAKAGVLKIPPLEVRGDDGHAVTKEIQILCEEKPQESSADGAAGFQARAELSAAEAVPGQQVVYTLRLFSPKSFAGAEFSPPDFKGLDARELTKWKKYTRMENGMAVVVNEIKFLVQAKAPGQYEIGPAVFTVQEAVRQGSRRGTDPFDSFFSDPFFNRVQTRPVRVVSNAPSLDVRALPAYGGTDRFSGLVGTFTIGASLDKETVTAGDSVTLTVVVQGRGNVMDIGAVMPALDEAEFKVYPDAPEEEISPTDKGLAGKKIFRAALVPKAPGKLSVPEITLNFFDTGAHQYRMVATAPLSLEVLPRTREESGSGQDTPGSAAPADRPGFTPVAKADVKMKNQDILEIREDISAIASTARMPLPWFVLWLVLPGIGFGVFALVLGQRRRQPDERGRARKKTEALIRKAAATDPGDPGFLQALKNGLTALILSRAGREGENLTCAEAEAILSESGVDREIVVQMVEMMEGIDLARFGGKSMDEDNARQCLKQIRSWARTLVLLLALSLSFTAPPPARASEPATRFVDAVRDYKAGRFEQAAKGFEAIAAEGVENPSLFYNTGNAWLRDNRLGRAVLWYERALRLAPSDPDIRFNLAHARTLVKDRIDHPLTARDILFFWKGTVSLRMLQIFAVAASLCFFIWAAVRVSRQKRVFTGTGKALLLAFLLLTSMAFLEEVRLDSDTRAVILSPQVAVRSGTQDTATPLFDLHTGTLVKVLEKKGNHIKIGIAGGKVGWVSLADAEVI